MKKKMLNLLAQKKTILDRMSAANDGGDNAAYDAAKAELGEVNASIDRCKEIMDELERIPAEPKQIPAAPMARRNSNATMHAFAECIRSAARGNMAKFAENRATLFRAVRNEEAPAADDEEPSTVIAGMNEGTAADGGLIVPTDIQTKINELMRDNAPLADLFGVENVTAKSGWRVVDTHPTAGFTKFDELDLVPEDAKPAFAKVEYSVDDYGLIVPISNDLLNDTDQNLIAYVSGWMAKKGVLTENALLIALLAAKDAAATSVTSTKPLATIKGLLNKSLDPAIAARAGFITNQTGFNFLDTLEDTTGRPLLQIDPQSRTSYLLMGRPVRVISDAQLSNDTTSGTKAPIYVGDFEQYGRLFRRQPLEIATTNIGGNAWKHNATEMRAIMRLDAVAFDTAAVVAGKITIS